MNPRHWHVAHLAARDYYSVPRFLHERGRLAGFYTDFWLPSPLSRFEQLLGRMSGRYHPELPGSMVRAENFRSLFRHFKTGSSVFADWVRIGKDFAERAAADIVRRGLRPDHGILAYTSGSLELLELAAAHEIPGVHVQIDPGPAWYRTRAAELRLWPGAESDPGMPDAAYLDRVQAEWRAASMIIVNSNHSADSLIDEGVPREKVRIVPLGSNLVPLPNPLVAPTKGEPLRILFAGSVSVAKGFPYLAEAARMLGKGFELHAAGGNRLHRDFIDEKQWPVRFHGHVSRARLSELMRSSHVLVFPTLSDGFGLVQLEAMAHGLPVIATPCCGGVVEDGLSGFVVAPRSAEAIADRLQRLRADPALLTRMSRNALARIGAFDAATTAGMLMETLDAAA